MIASWAQRYVGIPWQVHGRDRSGIDCWGLLCLAYREVYAIDLPTFDAEYTGTTLPVDAAHLADLFAQRWPLEGFRELRPDEAAIAGDVMLFRLFGRACHVGIYAGDHMVLHVRAGVDSCLERVDGPSWKPRLAGVYRHQALSLVVVRANPLQASPEVLAVPEGVTVQEVLEAAALPLDPRIGITLDGRLVPPSEWPTTSTTSWWSPAMATASAPRSPSIRARAGPPRACAPSR